MTDIIEAHKHSIRHKSKIISDDKCGCFCCISIYTPSEIVEWIDDGEDSTALCPICGIDSVIGESSGYPIELEFLTRMKKHWFDGIG